MYWQNVIITKSFPPVVIIIANFDEISHNKWTSELFIAHFILSIDSSNENMPNMTLIISAMTYETLTLIFLMQLKLYLFSILIRDVFKVQPFVNHHQKTCGKNMKNKTE